MEDKAYTGTDVLENLTDAHNYNRFLMNLILPYIKEDSCILDFGAGIGTYADMFQTYRPGMQPECLEVDAAQSNLLEKKGYTVYKDSSQLPEKRFDVIYTLNVLEHIEDDAAALAALRRALKPEGILIIYVPAIQSLYSEFDRKLGHYRRYHKKPLRELLESTDFVIDQLRFQDFLGYFAAMAYKTLKGSSGDVSVKQILFYDRLIFPVSRVFDHLFFGLIGKNLYAVCRPAASSAV